MQTQLYNYRTTWTKRNTDKNTIPAHYTPCLNKNVPLLFFKKLRETLAEFVNYWLATAEKKQDVKDYSFAHLTSILLLHYLVKFRSFSLAVYSTELILSSACVDSEMINWTATNTSNKYYLSESFTCYITSFLLLRMLKTSRNL